MSSTDRNDEAIGTLRIATGVNKNNVARSILSEGQREVVDFVRSCVELLLEDEVDVVILKELLKFEHALPEDVLAERLKLDKKLLRARIRIFPQGVVSEDLVGGSSSSSSAGGGLASAGNGAGTDWVAARMGVTSAAGKGAGASGGAAAGAESSYFRIAPEIGHVFGAKLKGMVDSLLAEERRKGILAPGVLASQSPEAQIARKLQERLDRINAAIPAGKTGAATASGAVALSGGKTNTSKGNNIKGLSSSTAGNKGKQAQAPLLQPHTVTMQYRCASGVCPATYREIDMIKYLSADGTGFTCPKCKKHPLTLLASARVETTAELDGEEVNLLNAADVAAMANLNRGGTLVGTAAGAGAVTSATGGRSTGPGSAARRELSKLEVFDRLCGSLFARYAERLRGVSLPLLPLRDPFERKTAASVVAVTAETSKTAGNSTMSKKSKSAMVMPSADSLEQPYFLRPEGVRNRDPGQEDGVEEDATLGSFRAKARARAAGKAGGGGTQDDDQDMQLGADAEDEYAGPVDNAMRERNRGLLQRARRLMKKQGSRQEGVIKSGATHQAEARKRRIYEILDGGEGGKEFCTYGTAPSDRQDGGGGDESHERKKVAIRYLTPKILAEMNDEQYADYFRKADEALALEFGDLYRGRF
eukprot:g14269.t1